MKYAITGLAVRTVKIGTHAQVVTKTTNVVISHSCFAEDSMELFLSACQICMCLFLFVQPIKFFICCVVVAVAVTSAKALKLQFKVGSADFSEWSVTLGKQHCFGGGLRVVEVA